MSHPIESPSFRSGSGPFRTLIIAAALLLTAGMALRVSSSVAEGARAIPAPALAEPVTQQMTSEVAIVAGGCFWGVQGVFQHVEGVTGAISGYAGGTRDAAQYETVSTGTTGHAEAVRISFDPHRISYGRILQIYFSVAHDPTEINRQGPDVGTQYRSAIFPANQEQARVAEAYIAQLNEARVFPATIATRVEPGREFYPAEAYHQDYLTRNPTNLGHPLLEPRLDLCTRIVLELEVGSLHEIFGSPDDMKFQSSMTLFAVAAAEPASVFYRALDRWCGGTLDPQTLKLLEAGGPR